MKRKKVSKFGSLIQDLIFKNKNVMLSEWNFFWSSNSSSKINIYFVEIYAIFSKNWKVHLYYNLNICIRLHKKVRPVCWETRVVLCSSTNWQNCFVPMKYIPQKFAKDIFFKWCYKFTIVIFLKVKYLNDIQVTFYNV